MGTRGHRCGLAGRGLREVTSALALLACLALLWPAPASASDTHYQNFLIGERASGMGGAFVALGDEATGAYYNPAGLANIRLSVFSLSMSAYGMQSVRQGQGFGMDASLRDVETAKRVVSFPVSFGFVASFGGDDETGVGRHAVALNVLIPEFLDVTTETDLGDVVLGGQFDAKGGALKVRVVDREFWFGLAYAYKPLRWLSVGAALFYRLRIGQWISDQTLVFASSDFLEGTSELSYTSGTIFAHVGVQLHLRERWHVGLSLQSPSVDLHSDGRGLIINSAAAGGQSTSTVARYEGLEVRSHRPAVLSLGLAYRWPERFTIALDTKLHLPKQAYVDIVDPSLPEEDLAQQPFGVFIERELTVNVNLGGELQLSERLVGRAGLFTNLTSAPRLDLESKVAQPHVHMYGATLGLTMRSKVTTLSLALNYLYGSGEGRGVTVNSADGSLTRRRVEISRHLLFIQFGGSYGF
jgi:hypothetical protein